MQCVTEIVGEASSGKSNLCLTAAAVNACRGIAVTYIETKQTSNHHDRLLGIAQARFSLDVVNCSVFT